MIRIDKPYETTLEHDSGNATYTLFSSETSIVNRINKLHKAFPEDVKIKCVNQDGSIVAHIPKTWVKISPKRRGANNLSDEEKRARSERMRIARAAKSEKTDKT